MATGFQITSGCCLVPFVAHGTLHSFGNPTMRLSPVQDRGPAQSPYPVPLFCLSVYTPPGRQQSFGQGPKDRFVPLALIAPTTASLPIGTHSEATLPPILCV